MYKIQNGIQICISDGTDHITLKSENIQNSHNWWSMWASYGMGTGCDHHTVHETTNASMNARRSLLINVSGLFRIFSKDKDQFQLSFSALKTHVINPILSDPQRQLRCAHTVQSISSVSVTLLSRSCIQWSLWLRHKKMSTGGLKCIMAARSLCLYLFIRYWIGIN